MDYIVVPVGDDFHFKLKSNNYSFATFRVGDLSLTIKKSGLVFDNERFIFIFDILKKMGYEYIQTIKIV